MKLLCKSEYEENLAATRDRRMKWFREARFGMFVHFGLYSQLGRQEWVQVLENIPKEEYALLADSFCPKKGAPREWARLAKESGMKYMVLTCRHHEGFSLWDSKVNEFNSVNYGPHRDIVKEYVDACHEFGLKVGFYNSLMDWHHPDAFTAAYDSAARARFNEYIYKLNEELLTNYGKIDILWYDCAIPMETFEGWNSLELNQRLRALQPDIIINNRSKLNEDFGTPEENLNRRDGDWEACMTFNGIGWGYVDEEQTAGFNYTPQAIIKMLTTCARSEGNLLLNIGPRPDGSVPSDVISQLHEVGRWLEMNGEAIYGKKLDCGSNRCGGNGICYATTDGSTVYFPMWIWPKSGEMGIGGYKNAPVSVEVLGCGRKLEFEHKGHRLLFKNLGEKPDVPAGIPVIAAHFDPAPDYCFASYYPQLNGGREFIDKPV